MNSFATKRKNKILAPNCIESQYILGRRLREVRMQSGLSIRAAAAKSGIHYTSLSHYETTYRFPSIFVAARLAKVYGVSLDELVRGL